MKAVRCDQRRMWAVVAVGDFELVVWATVCVRAEWGRSRRSLRNQAVTATGRACAFKVGCI